MGQNLPFVRWDRPVLVGCNSVGYAAGMLIEITLITTGGTIDGADSDNGTLRHSSDAAKWLDKQRDVRVVYVPLLNKDSRLLTDDNREKIVEAVYNAASNCVLVTHGTFTICETGRAIKAAEKRRGLTKAVLLVGSWTPFGESNSDAPAQMKFALQKLREGHSGVFVAMDGRLWNPETTEKVEVTPGNYRLSKIAR